MFDAEVGETFFNSLEGWPPAPALFGSALVFAGAYLLPRRRAPAAASFDGFLRARSCACSRCCRWRVPGLVCSGLGTILFFNDPDNPLRALYHTLTLLTLCTIVHFYTTGHLTAVTALKGLDDEFEAVSASLKVPFYKTFWRVTLPICMPVLLDVSRYFFINAMTTISAVVFLYALRHQGRVRSRSSANLDEAGETSAPRRRWPA